MNEENYMLSHREVQRMVRNFLGARGYTIITKRYNKKLMASIKSHSGSDRYKPDDVFMSQTGEKIVCEYKPEPSTRMTIYTGIGQCLVSSAESGLRSYLVISETDFLRFLLAIANAPWLGLFIYNEGKIVRWRKPVDLISLPNPNEPQEV